jgi:hypothetical protein
MRNKSEKYTITRKYANLKVGTKFCIDWNIDLLSCFRFLPSSELSKLENFSGEFLLTRPSPNPYLDGVSETRVCNVLFDYLQNGGYLANR